jgi:amidohydrolase
MGWSGVLRWTELGLLFCPAALFLAPSAAVAQPDQDSARNSIDSDYGRHLRQLFVDLHRNPELSFNEVRTARVVARELEAAGARVTERVGGTGVVGVLENGPGPVVLMRAEMDALPIREQSGLPYASTAVHRNADGTMVPVAHACGHDANLTSMVGAARAMNRSRDRWRGTIIFVAQPAEERSAGARMLIEDGLYERFPKPNFALTAHVDPEFATNTINADPGVNGSSADTVEIVVHGVGAHGASPHLGKDAILIGAEIVVALQTLVSREVSPFAPAVVTVGKFNAGLDQNTIAERAELKVTIRADDEETRQKLIAGVKRIATQVARLNGLAEDRLPEIRVVEPTPVTINDPQLTARLRNVLASRFGRDRLITVQRTSMGADDFSFYIEARHAVPGFYMLVGATPSEILERARSGGPPVASLHAAEFKVDADRTIPFAVDALVTIFLDLLRPAQVPR